VQEAASSGGSAREILARRTGLSGTAYARALATAFDYRFIDGEELAQVEPDFAKLAPAEATRRLCVVVRERGHLVAIFADPFDTNLRGWLELRISEEFTWALAPREHLANLIARRAEALRAIDSVLPDAQRAAGAEQRIDTLSYVSISEDASPVVRLVHS